MPIQLFTIGSSKKNAETFFRALRNAKIQRVLDIRLRNNSVFAGFTKRDDLRFFLREICEADYHHFSQCAPTPEMLDAYKKTSDWTLMFKSSCHSSDSEKSRTS